MPSSWKHGQTYSLGKRCVTQLLHKWLTRSALVMASPILSNFHLNLYFVYPVAGVFFISWHIGRNWFCKLWMAITQVQFQLVRHNKIVDPKIILHIYTTRRYIGLLPCGTELTLVNLFLQKSRTIASDFCGTLEGVLRCTRQHMIDSISSTMLFMC